LFGEPGDDSATLIEAFNVSALGAAFIPSGDDPPSAVL